MSLSSEFLKPYFKKHGPQIEESDFTKENWAFLKHVQEEIRYLVIEYCKFCSFQVPIIVFHNDSFSMPKYTAYSEEKNNGRIIGVTVTMALVLRKYFMFALSHRSKVSEELKPPTVENLKTLYSYQDIPLPLNKGQHGLAEDLARVALTYVVAHELAHLKLGHCNYVEKRKADTDSLDYLAMELMADRCAADILMSYALMIEKNFNEDLTRLLPIWLSAIGSAFRLNWTSDSWASNLYASKHPPSQYRGIAAITQLLLHFKEKKHWSVVKVGKIFEFMSDEIERFHEDVTGVQERRLHGVQFLEFLKKQEEYTSKLVTHHSKLFPDAQCHS